MMKIPLPAIILAALLAGCAGNSGQPSLCGYSLSPEAAPDASAVNVSRDFLSAHPALMALLSKPVIERDSGVGYVVSCDEGEAAMAALAARGATLKTYDSGSKETSISYEGQPYRLLLGYAVAN